VFQGLVDGLKVLHGLGIAHHDLKLSNFVMRTAELALIIDFGLAAKLPPPQPIQIERF